MNLTYDEYVVLASKYHLKSNYQDYILHRDGLKIIEQIASTANTTMKLNGAVIVKPLKQHEAKKVITRLQSGKYDSNFKKVFSLVN